MMIRLLFLGFFITFINLSYSQENLPEYMSPTPQAAALSKYSEYPIGNFTGIPNISVPLYTIIYGDISLPMDLNYHAGGFKVTEEASWIGLGWTLSVNNVITRTVNGVDDFYGNVGNGVIPYLDAPKIIDIKTANQFDKDSEREFSYRSRGSNNVFVNNVIKDYSNYSSVGFDWEPDVFSINVLGLNGKFVLDQEGNVHFINKVDVEVTKTTTGWKVRTNDGFQYHFDQKESSYNFYGSLFNESWYLTKIISPTKRELIFIYNQDLNDSWQYNYSDRAIEMGAGTNYDGKIFELDFDKITEIKTKTVYLNRIEFDLGYVEFNLSPNLREDLKNGKKLDNIKIKDLNHNLIKEFEFQTNYFESNTPRGFLSNLSVEDYNYYKKRLKLNKVIEKNGSESQEYKFTYSSLGLPNKDSFSQDYWGYFNAKTNRHLIASFEGELPVCIFWTLNYYNSERSECSMSNYCKYKGSNRNSNAETMEGNILKEIIYPTGGKTTFEFEANEYSNQNEVGEGYTYEPFVKDVRVIGFNDKPDIVQYSPATLPSDVVDFLAPQVDLRAYSTDASPLSIPPSLQFLLHMNNGQTTMGYFASSFLNNQNTSYTDESLSEINEGPINWTVNNFSDMDYNQTIIATFKCILKRNYSPSKKTAGGLRIKKIIHHDPVSQDDIIKTYDYDYSDSNGLDISYGKLKTPTKFWSFHLPLIENLGGSGFTHVSFFPSNSHRLSLSQTSHIGYSKVIEKYEVNGESGKIEYNYHNSTNVIYDNLIRPHGVPNSKPVLYDGRVESIVTYNNNNNKVQKESYEYGLLDESIVKGIYQDGVLKLLMGLSYLFGRGGLHYYPIFSRWEAMTKKTTEAYDLAGNLNNKNTAYYEYNEGNLLPSSVINDDSKGNVLKTKTYYANDVENVNSLGEALDYTSEYFPILNLRKKHSNGSDGEYKTSIPIQVDVYKNDTLLSRQRTIFDNNWADLNITLPKKTQIAKGTERLEDRVVYHDYDLYGNPIEVFKKDGTSIYYVWGYHGEYPIAKIENFTSFEAAMIQTSLIDPAVIASHNDNSEVSEETLRNKLQLLRSSLPHAMVTTYTYDPLVGVTSMTDPNGYTVYYEYDGLNRLKLVRDDEGNILSTNYYHYKNQ